MAQSVRLSASGSAAVAPSGVDGLLVALPAGGALSCFGGGRSAPEDPALAVYLPAGREDVRQRLLRLHVAQARGEDAVRGARGATQAAASTRRGRARTPAAPRTLRWSPASSPHIDA